MTNLHSPIPRSSDRALPRPRCRKRAAARRCRADPDGLAATFGTDRGPRPGLCSRRNLDRRPHPMPQPRPTHPDRDGQRPGAAPPRFAWPEGPVGTPTTARRFPGSARCPISARFGVFSPWSCHPRRLMRHHRHVLRCQRPAAAPHCRARRTRSAASRRTNVQKRPFRPI